MVILFLICRYFSERGDAVAKASKETHVVSDSTALEVLQQFITTLPQHSGTDALQSWWFLI